MRIIPTIVFMALFYSDVGSNCILSLGELEHSGAGDDLVRFFLRILLKCVCYDDGALLIKK